MHPGTDTFEYVYGSRARREVLLALAATPRSRRAVVEACESSESSVYDALNKLQRRGLVHQRGDAEWTTTGGGRIVADAIDGCTAIDDVLDDDGEYWEGHDVSVLPQRFRRSIGDLRGCDVVRSPSTDPYRANRTVAEAIRTANSVSILTPIYHDRFASALAASDATEKRLLMTPAMVRGMAANDPDPPSEGVEDVDARVGEFDLALTVTDEQLLLSLPSLDGTYDPETELRADADAAIQWGRRLFGAFWREGIDVEDLNADAKRAPEPSP